MTVNEHGRTIPTGVLGLGLVGWIALAGLGIGYSQSVRLAWDASPSPGVTNYVVYGSTNQFFYTNLAAAPLRYNNGTNLTVLVEPMKAGRYYFTPTAMANGLQSTNSNVLAVEVPESPGMLYTVELLWGAEVGSVTNSALFLKLKPAK